jgi:ribosomal protein S20
VKRFAVKAALPRQRRKDVVENDSFAAFVRRIIRAYSRRVASGDIEAITDLVDLSVQVDTAITDAVRGLRSFGYSWTEIGSRLGISRQACQQRWGGEKP